MVDAGCRSCGAPLRGALLDLGAQPVGELLEARDLRVPEPTRPLGVTVCESCWLLQLAMFDAAPAVADEHGHGSAYSTTTSTHELQWAQELIAQLGVDRRWRIVEVGGGDSMLHHFPGSGARVGDPGSADLVLANHTLAHLDGLDDFLAGIQALLAPNGRFSTEFVHALQMIEQAQFDLVCHAHRCYLSLTALLPGFARHGLEVVHAKEVAVHGGSVRVLVRHASRSASPDGSVANLQRREASRGLTRLQSYRSLATRASQTRAELRGFLEESRRRGQPVVAYGAPARGNTLLNYCGVTTELVRFTVDRSPQKQGRYLSGSRLPVLPPQAIDELRPAYVLILPWTIREEIMLQLQRIKRWGGRFVLPLPRMRVVD